MLLVLRSYGSPLSIIGEQNEINITISSNDYPYGLFGFQDQETTKRIGKYWYLLIAQIESKLSDLAWLIYLLSFKTCHVIYFGIKVICEGFANLIYLSLYTFSKIELWFYG